MSCVECGCETTHTRAGEPICQSCEGKLLLTLGVE